MRNAGRCAESGAKSEMSHGISPLRRGPLVRMAEESRLKVSPQTLSGQLTTVGGMDSTAVERLF